MSDTRTEFFVNGRYQYNIPAYTLQEFVDEKRLIPGQRITIKLGDDVPQIFWVGDATPFHCPTENDCGFGWPKSAEMSAKVLRVEKF